MHADVIVIGAGMAGLAAADWLGRRGRSVIIVEARDRVGGRVFSAPSGGWPCPTEFGAEFMHGGSPALRSLLRKAGLRTRAVQPNMWWRENEALRLVPDFWERIERVAKTLPPRDRGWSVADFVKQAGTQFSTEDRWLLMHYAGGFNAAPIEALSAAALRADHAGADNTDYKIIGHYGAVADTLRERFKPDKVTVRLKTVVTRIEWKRGSVGVFTRAAGDSSNKEECHHARAAVVTLPVGVLQGGDVTFSPALGRKQTAIDAVGWGQVVRMTLRFRSGFWSRPVAPEFLWKGQGKAFGFVNAPGEYFPVWWALNPPAPVLTGWAGGEAAERLAGLPPARLRKLAIKSLAEIWKTSQRSIDEQLIDWRTHDWRGDPYTRGAYSFAKAGQEQAGRQLASPLRDTLFFAGEATAGDIGTVHGAVDSGLRAAREIDACWR